MAGIRLLGGKVHAAQSAGHLRLEAARRNNASADDPKAQSEREPKGDRRKPPKGATKAADAKAIRVGVIDYKDVAALRKFISDRGKIRARRITGVSVQEQRLIARAIKNAREMGHLDSGTGKSEPKDVGGDPRDDFEVPTRKGASDQQRGPDGLEPLRSTVVTKRGIYLSTGQDPLVSLSGEEAELIAKVLKKVREPRPEMRISPAEILSRVTAAIPDRGPSPWDQLVGPFYSTSSLSVLRGVSRQALQKMRDSDKLLSVTTSDRKILYPTFQFDETGEPVPRMDEVLSVLGEAIADGWTRSLWFTGPVESWGGQSAIEKLRSREPRDFEDVLVAAREAASVRGQVAVH